MEPRYVLVQDNDCHWYVVNVNDIRRARDFFDNEYEDALPDWIHRVGGSPVMVTFSNPQIGMEWVR